MALRIKLRREFKIAIEEDGYSQEEIKEQLDHLVDEEIEGKKYASRDKTTKEQILKN